MARTDSAEIEARVAQVSSILKIDHLLDPKARPAFRRPAASAWRSAGRSCASPTSSCSMTAFQPRCGTARSRMRIEIARLHRELGNTMVYVTHDQTEAMTLADQIVVLRDGRIEQAGSPRDVYEDPANMFVAGFIGSPRMNFLDAQWQGDGTIRVGETTLEAAIDGGSLRHGERLLFCIRPEHIAVAEPGPERITAQVEFSEYLGGTRYLYCQLEDGQSLVVEQREGPNWQAGERLSSPYRRTEGGSSPKTGGVCGSEPHPLSTAAWPCLVMQMQGATFKERSTWRAGVPINVQQPRGGCPGAQGVPIWPPTTSFGRAR